MPAGTVKNIKNPDIAPTDMISLMSIPYTMHSDIPASLPVQLNTHERNIDIRIRIIGEMIKRKITPNPPYNSKGNRRLKILFNFVLILNLKIQAPIIPVGQKRQNQRALGD